jgi:hypothetical protein
LFFFFINRFLQNISDAPADIKKIFLFSRHQTKEKAVSVAVLAITFTRIRMTECKAIEGARKPTVDVLVTDFARQCDMVRANCKRIVELKPTATSDAPNPISLRKRTQTRSSFFLSFLCKTARVL